MARRTFPASSSASLFDAPPALVISCDDCAMDGTDACTDCLVPFLLGHGEQAARPERVALDAGEAVTLCLLQQAGLAPELRHPRHAPLLAVLGGRG